MESNRRNRVLVIDDEPNIRFMLNEMLSSEGFEVALANGREEALQHLGSGRFDAAICDIKMPDVNGLDLLREMLDTDPYMQVVMITAYTSREDALKAMEIGAYDYISKPFDIKELRELVFKAIEKRHLLEENRELKEELAATKSGALEQMVGRSEAMQQVFETIRQVAPTKSTVLITGESGTGKELTARAIHSLSDRADKPFVAINCGAIPKELIESELFGHKKGAFTGAITDKPGLFVQAQGGTVFLDEIGELPHDMQVKLLRAIEERKIRPVGAQQEIPIDIRIIAATNRNLAEMVANHEFREDLYYRLNVINVELPPLRERRDDIPRLAHTFIEQSCKEMGVPLKTLSPAAMDKLLGYEFPGNVRELKNVLERAVVLSRGVVIGPEAISLGGRGGQPKDEQVLADSKEQTDELGHGEFDSKLVLPAEVGETGIDLERILEEVEAYYLRKALERSGGNKTEAARLLNMSLRSLRYRMSKLKLS